MKQGEKRAIGRCYGSTVVGPRGQVVIPVKARKELSLEVGSRLLVFSHFGDKGLLLLKVEAVEELLNVMSRRLTEFARLVKESKAAGIPEGNEGDNG